MKKKRRKSSDSREIFWKIRISGIPGISGKLASLLNSLSHIKTDEHTFTSQNSSIHTQLLLYIVYSLLEHPCTLYIPYLSTRALAEISSSFLISVCSCFSSSSRSPLVLSTNRHRRAKVDDSSLWAKKYTWSTPLLRQDSGGDFAMKSDLRLAFAYSLLYLVAAVGAGQVHNQLELAGGIVHILALEGSLLGFVCPRQPLIHIEQSIHCTTHSNHAPPSCLSNLEKERWWSFQMVC